jgi:ribonuclease-3
MSTSMEIDGDRIRLLRDFLSGPPIRRRRVDDRTLARYHQSLVHRSFIREEDASGSGDNERLEFLGDRVLNLIVAEFLYQTYPGSEGELTARMEWTENRNLARAVTALDIGFEDLVLVGISQEKTPRIVAGAFEAFVAALYLDLGMIRTKAIVLQLMAEEIREYRTDRNYKKILQEYFQKQNRPLPAYALEDRSGVAHQPSFTYVVTVDGEIIGRGVGRSKAEATQNAARQALNRLNGIHED